MHVRRIQAPVPEPTFTIEGLTSMQLAVLADALRNNAKQNTSAIPIYDEVHRHLERYWADTK